MKTASKSSLVLITGASSGIGLATARYFASKAYNLVLTARRKEKLDALKLELETKFAIEVTTLDFDVRVAEDVEKSLNSLGSKIYEIDILINNAGLAKGYAPIHKGNLDHWNTMIDTNIKGLLYLTRIISPIFVEKKAGHIINVASTAGHEVYPNGNVYCASKFAVDALTKSIRLDLHKYNIKVSQVSPGHVEETEFALNRFDGDANKSKIYDDFVPLNSNDVAEIIFFIASRKSNVNIQDILVMGTQQASNNYINRSGRS